jgi:hypothetical protein
MREIANEVLLRAGTPEEVAAIPEELRPLIDRALDMSCRDGWDAREEFGWPAGIALGLTDAEDLEGGPGWWSIPLEELGEMLPEDEEELDGGPSWWREARAAIDGEVGR